MLSSYFLEVRTNTDYPLAEYDAAAGRLTQMLVSILSDQGSAATLTHDAPRKSFHSEIEVMLESGELVAKVVVDIVADENVKFDKSKWTKLLKARPEADEWKKMKINKRQVPNVPEGFNA